MSFLVARVVGEAFDGSEDLTRHDYDTNLFPIEVYIQVNRS